MSRRLILMRHAKSGWDEPGISDHDRKLNARGRAACDIVGPWLSEIGAGPDEVLCSDAARTRETWDRLSRHMSGAAAPTLFSRLYLADAPRMTDILKSANGRVVALIGHNPGIGQLSASLAAAPPDHADFGRFPTLSTLILEFAIDRWSDLDRVRGRVLHFAVPRDLMA